ncbi:MAG: hypothetical protein R3B49_09275 [Phycisphaerales bacterium]
MPTNPAAVRAVFAVAAVYDGGLGLAFLFAQGPIFDAAGVTRPNHPGYVQFAAALLIVFAAMFVRVARRPADRRELMVYAVLLKLAFAGVVLWNQLFGSIPTLWLPFAGLDAAWACLFAWCFVATRPRPASSPA